MDNGDGESSMGAKSFKSLAPYGSGSPDKMTQLSHVGPRAQVHQNQKNLVSVIENINEVFGIKGKVRLDGFDVDSEAANDGKDALDQGGGGGMLDNEDINKCSRR